LTFLSREAKEDLHRAAMRILGEIGMQVIHDEAQALLRDHGCQVDGEGVAKIPASLVDEAVKSAPKSIDLVDREGSPAMDLGGDRCYFGTGSDLLYRLHYAGGQVDRRRSVLDDVRSAARLCDALPNIDFVMSLATPSDVPPMSSYLLSFVAMVENTTKPIVCTADSGADLERIWRIASILRGGEQALRERPYVIHYAEPVSPLKHPGSSVDKLLLCADRGVPLVYSPAPIAGSTAPMTIAGHVAQGLAECLCGLVIHQLRAGGAPFLMGMGPAVLDMKTVECSYNAPEYYLAYVTMIEMSHFYDLPSWGYAGTSDSQLPDGQAAIESSMVTFLAAMCGCNLNHDVGYLDFGRTGSLEMVVIQDELIDLVRRMLRGIPVDEEMIGLDAIREAGWKGNFLGHPHTRRHVRSTQWRPDLICRLGHERWRAEGSTTLLDRARQKLEEILAEHRAPPLPPEQAEAIQEVVDEFR
jgi:trimethylamine--corrinoid protein Co-methyltransferase